MAEKMSKEMNIEELLRFYGILSRKVDKERISNEPDPKTRLRDIRQQILSAFADKDKQIADIKAENEAFRNSSNSLAINYYSSSEKIGVWRKSKDALSRIHQLGDETS